MSKSEIHALLGAPDFSQLDFGPKGPNEKWLGSSWMYYLSKRGPGVNLNDPRVEIFFDTNDRAQWIVPGGIKGAQEIGSVNERCT